MNTQWVDVVDSAIKIGLGCVISGFFMYVNQKSNHNNVARIEARKTEMDLLLGIQCNVDRYVRLLNDAHGAFDGVRITSQKYDDFDWDDWDGLWDHVYKYFQRLYREGENFTTAQSKLRLLGLTKAIEALEGIGKLEDELRELYNELSDCKAHPTEKYIKNWHARFKSNVDKFRNEMAEHYSKLLFI